MASYNELNALIDAYINRNGVQAITGQILNGVLKAMVEQLGRGYTIMGAATPTTDPGTPDGPECWFASETGTYTDFDGLQVVPGELAILCYTPTDGWTKATIYEGFQEVEATIDGNVGTPSVGVSYADGVLSFDFRNMKGNPGNDGDAAGFGTINATVDGNVGTPGVSVQSSGPDTAKNITFQFTNLKGETGVTSVVATVDNTVGTPTCTVSLVGQQLTLAFSGLKGAQGDTGSSVDYPFTIVNNLTTNDPTQALSAAMGVQLEAEFSQLEAKVDVLDKDIHGGTITDETTTEYTNSGFIAVSDGQITNPNSTWIHSDFIKISEFVFMEKIAGHASVAAFAFYSAADFSSYISGLNGTDATPYVTDGKVSAQQLAQAVPAGANYVIFSTNGASEELKVTTGTSVVVTGLEHRIDDLEESVSGYDERIEDIEGELDGSSETTTDTTQYSLPGYIQRSDGTVGGTSSTWIHSDLIPLSKFVKAGIFKTHGVVANAAFYSRNEISSASYISYLAFGDGTECTKEEITIPEGAEYVAFSTDGANFALNVTTEETIVTPGLSEKVEDLEAETTDLDGRVSALENEVIVSLPTKSLHFSFDDTIAALYDIYHNNRASIFDNAFFGALKNLHDTYGAVFSCYCFLYYFNLKWVSKLSTIVNPDTTAVYFLGSADGEYAANTWYVYRNSVWTVFTDALRDDYKIFSLSSMPSTWASEFSANSAWLKFGLHGRDGMVNYQSATAEEATTDYNSFISSIVTITGTVACVDTVVRLQNFAGNVNVCRAMRDADLGIQGLLCSDYSETSGGSGGSSGGYFVSSALATAVWKKGQIYDYAERLHFYASGLRMDNTTSADMPTYMAKFLTPDKWEQTAIIEMYCHENQMYKDSDNTLTSDYVARFEAACTWAVANGFTFGFQMDKIRMAF